MSARRCLAACVAATWLGAPLASANATEASEPRIVAVLVGANHPGSAELAPLQYADDDARQAYELFQSLGVEAGNLFLLAEPGSDSPTARSDAEPPATAVTKHALQEALDAALERVSALKRDRQRVELFVWFSGHGGPARGAVGSTEGALYLSDGDYTTSELYAGVLGQSEADDIHLIIDACGAGSFVNARGPQSFADRRAEYRGQLLVDGLPKQNVGYAIAAAGDQNAREWSEYQSGIFSLMVRSALRGAADVDNDGRVTYGELRAYVERANEGVEHAKAKLAPQIVAPRRYGGRGRDKALVRWSTQQTPILIIDRPIAGRFFVEDALGVRLVGAHKSDEQGLVLRLPKRESYFVSYERPEQIAMPAPYAEARSYVLEIGRTQRKIFSTESPVTAPARPARRGSEAEALRNGLYRLPFGVSAYERACQGSGGTSTGCAVVSAYPRLDDAAEPASDNYRGSESSRVWLSPWILGGAAAAGVTGLVFYKLSNDSFEKYENATNPDAERRWKSDTRRNDWGASIAFGVGAAAAVAGGWLLMSELGGSADEPSVSIGWGRAELRLKF